MKPVLIFMVALFLASPFAVADGDAEDKGFRDPVLDALLRDTDDADDSADRPVVTERSPRKEEAKEEVPDTDEPDPELDELLEKMNAKRETINRVRADVARTRSAPLISDRKDEHKGELWFRSPRLLRLELRGPTHLKEDDQRTVRTIVTEEYAYMWHVDSKEAERFKLPDIDDTEVTDRNPFEYGLAADLRTMKDDYFLTRLGEETLGEATTVRVRARPRPHVRDPRYDELVFWVDKELLVPVQFRQVQSNGEIVDTYRLTDIRLNPWWLRNPFTPPPSSVSLIRHDLAN